MFERKLIIKDIQSVRRTAFYWALDVTSTDYSENKEEDGVNTTRIRTIFKGLFGHFILKQTHMDY